jgi:hypothetical protein
MSLLPQGQLAVYAVQGKEPLATRSDWATTLNDRKDAKAPPLKLIAPIAILHCCKSAIRSAMKLVSL